MVDVRCIHKAVGDEVMELPLDSKPSQPSSTCFCFVKCSNACNSKETIVAAQHLCKQHSSICTAPVRTVINAQHLMETLHETYIPNL